MSSSSLPAKFDVNLSRQFCNELLDPSIDLGVDYSEIFIDDLIDNEVLKNIPIIKTFVGAIKGGIAINQFFFAKKLLTFIATFNVGLNPAKKLKFQEQINNDERFRKKVSEQVMVFIDRFLEITQAKISANLLKSFAEEKIDYPQLVSLNISLEKLHPDSYQFLSELALVGYAIDQNIPGDQRDLDNESLLQTSGLAAESSVWAAGFIVKKSGQLLYELGIKPLGTNP
jgi:hypothetical protein